MPKQRKVLLPSDQWQHRDIYYAYQPLSATLALIVVRSIKGNMCGPKLHLLLVGMREYRGAGLLYGNTRTLQYTLPLQKKLRHLSAKNTSSHLVKSMRK